MLFSHMREISNGYMMALEFTEEDVQHLNDVPWSESIFRESDAAVITFTQRMTDSMREELEQVVSQGNYSWEQMGHDIWFTRNGHGVGFWDRGLGDLGEGLTKIAESMGEVSVFINDREELEVEA
jgi:hypothetical protein